LHLLKLSVCPLGYSVNEADKTLLCSSTLSGGLSLYLCKLSLMGSPGLLLCTAVLSLLCDQLLQKCGELRRLRHL
jgi:hypothetical protein